MTNFQLTVISTAAFYLVISLFYNFAIKPARKIASTGAELTRSQSILRRLETPTVILAFVTLFIFFLILIVKAIIELVKFLMS